jgi:CHAD domain-containing protein
MSEAAGIVSLRPVAPVVNARPLQLDRNMYLKDVFHAALGECCTHIEANIAPVVQDRDVEGLHQLRVGLRRLNIALASFGRTPAREALRSQAKIFFAAAGTARDLDVFLAELFEPVVAELNGQDGFAVLRQRAEQLRVRAWDGAVAQVSSAAFKTFLDEAAAAADQWDDLLMPQVPVVSHAPLLLDGHLARVGKRGRGLKPAEHDRSHRLRIALKKLRYTSEFFATLYEEKPVRRYLKQLKQFQDLLGALNDAAQVRAVLGRLMMEATTSAPEQAELSFAAGLINGWHHARASDFSHKSRKRWRSFKRSQPFWN